MVFETRTRTRRFAPIDPAPDAVGDREVALVARLYVLLEDDVRSALPALDPEVEWISRDAGATAIHLGRDGVASMWRARADAFERYRHEPSSLERRGDQVIAVVDVHGKSRAEHRELRRRERHFWTFRDGLVTRVECVWR